MIFLISDNDAASQALTKAHVHAQRLNTQEASNDLGFAVGAELVVFGFAPGTHRLIEAQAFHTSATLYFWADQHTGNVGPLLFANATPCSACLPHATVTNSSDSVVLLNWAAAGVAIEIDALHHNRKPILLGTTLHWDRKVGTIGTRPLRGRVGCKTTGCTAASRTPR